MNSAMPSFFIIGAQKAGTTTLHHWLKSQPQVCLPDRKETHYFSHKERYALGPGWYKRQFSTGQDGIVFGEIDPDYLFFRQASKRIHRLGGKPRFVVVVREPLSRAYSHYCMSVRRGLESLSFGQALEAEEGRLRTGKLHHLKHHSYMARGQYSQQIARYQEVFGAAAVLIMTFDDLFDPRKSMAEFKRLCAFVGLAKVHSPKSMHQKHHTAGAARSRFINAVLWHKEKWRPVRSLVRRMFPWRDLKYRVGRFLDNANHKPVFKEPLPLKAVDHRFIVKANRETARLASITGMDLNQWINNRTIQ